MNIDEDENEQYYIPTKKRRLQFNTLKIGRIAIVADRYKVSDTMTAAIATAAFEVAGMITPENKALVIDKRKIARSFQIKKFFELPNE